MGTFVVQAARTSARASPRRSWSAGRWPSATRSGRTQCSPRCSPTRPPSSLLPGRRAGRRAARRRRRRARRRRRPVHLDTDVERRRARRRARAGRWRRHLQPGGAKPARCRRIRAHRPRLGAKPAGCRRSAPTRQRCGRAGAGTGTGGRHGRQRGRPRPAARTAGSCTTSTGAAAGRLACGAPPRARSSASTCSSSPAAARRSGSRHADLDAYLSGTRPAVANARSAAPTHREDVPLLGAAPADRRTVEQAASPDPAHHLRRGGRRHQLEGCARASTPTTPINRAAHPAAVPGPGDRARRRRPPAAQRAFDDEAEVLHVSGAVHVGIATQTERAAGAGRAARRSARRVVQRGGGRAGREAARTGKAGATSCGGSTITITSLGALGGIVTTPIINHPEVAIVGVNKHADAAGVGTGRRSRRDDDEPVLQLRPPHRRRVGGGEFVQRIKALLETPALLFVGSPP